LPYRPTPAVLPGRGPRSRVSDLPFASQADPSPGIVHAVNLFMLSATLLDLSMRALAQWRQKRAQTGKTVRADQAAKHEFTQRFLNHAWQKIRAGDDVHKKRRAMMLEMFVDGLCIGRKRHAV